MKKLRKKIARRNKIRKRIRSAITGTKERPRMSVFKSNKHIYVQLIDDLSGQTLVAASTLSNDLKEDLEDKSGVEKAEEVGKTLAEKAVKLNIDKVVYDRGGYKYHGQIKAVAEGAREAGLKL